jgi:hypothetical protein
MSVRFVWIIACGFSACLVVAALMRAGLGTEWLLVGTVLLLLVTLHRHSGVVQPARQDGEPRPVIHWSYWLAGLSGASTAVIAAHTYTIVRWVNAKAQKPPDWDFLCFWTFGKVAAAGHNIYEPANFRALDLPFEPSKYFVQEILEVGFWYPPMSILLFLPLGWVSDVAVAFWLTNGAVYGALLLSAFVLWRQFFSDASATLFSPTLPPWRSRIGSESVAALLVVAALVLASPATGANFFYTQTNAIALAFLLLGWGYRKRYSGGVWFALATLVKPYLGLFILYSLVRRRFRPIVGAAVFGAISAGAVGMLLGTEVFTSYIWDGPATRVPLAAFVADARQSLFSLTLRATNQDLSAGLPIVHPIFTPVALVLTGVTLWLAASLRKRDEDWAGALILLYGLLMYPGVLVHYSLMLLFPFAVMWKHRAEVPGGMSAVVGIIALCFVFMQWSFDYCFAATMLTWLVVAGMSFTWVQRARWKPLYSEAINEPEAVN